MSKFFAVRLLFCLVLIGFLGGCNQDELLKKYSSPQDQATVKHYIDLLRAHDFDAIEKDLDSDLRNSATRSTLEHMAASLPDGEPVSTKLVGASSNSIHTGNIASDVTHDTSIVNTTMEYAYGHSWLVANVAIRTRDGVRTIIGFNAVPSAKSLEEQNRFSFVGKTVAGYLMLAATVSVALLTIWALLLCIRTPLPRRKVLWIIFILIGIGKFSINWTTGHWSISPIYIQLLSASVMAQPYGPWVLSFSIPVGAITFLMRRRHLVADSK